MDFQKVTFDADIDGLEGDDARELVGEFVEAQEQNLAEFEQAVEDIEALEGRVGEVKEFDAELTEELVEASPLGEDEATAFSISRKRELLAEFAEEEDEEEEEAEEDEEEAEFSDMGKRGETHNEEETARTFAEDVIGDIPGLEL